MTGFIVLLVCTVGGISVNTSYILGGGGGSIGNKNVFCFRQNLAMRPTKFKEYNSLKNLYKTFKHNVHNIQKKLRFFQYIDKVPRINQGKSNTFPLKKNGNYIYFNDAFILRHLTKEIQLYINRNNEENKQLLLKRDHEAQYLCIQLKKYTTKIKELTQQPPPLIIDYPS